MNVLVACEFSGIVNEAFTKKGHNCLSCDLLPTEKPHLKHYRGDIRDILSSGMDWDLMVAHPPCTYLTVSGNKWFKPEFRNMYPNREKDRREAIDFFMLLINADIPKIAVENPVGIMSTVYRKPDQIVQPWMFGEPYQKSTCLFLKNLPNLRPTKIVEHGEMMTYKSGKRMSRWYAELRSLPKNEREKMRSRTFKGIADTMANQWGSMENEN